MALQQIGDVPVLSKREAVQLFVAAHGLSLDDIEPETLAFWLSSPYDALKVAAILLGVEHRPDVLVKKDGAA